MKKNRPASAVFFGSFFTGSSSQSAATTPLVFIKFACDALYVFFRMAAVDLRETMNRTDIVRTAGRLAASGCDGIGFTVANGRGPNLGRAKLNY